jgi:membrane protease YdiL (CAAX protease family)
MAAALLTAPLFALQHTPLVFGDSVVGGALIMAILVILAIPFRMVMAWIFNCTGSLFLVGLAHACGNAAVTSTVAGDALIPALYGRNLGPLHLFTFAVIGIGVAVGTRGRLGLVGVRTAAPGSEPAPEAVRPNP